MIIKHQFYQAIQIILLTLMAFASKFSHGQDIRIYHGTDGGTTLFLKNENEKNSSWRKNTNIIKSKGETIEITIINPNPILYTYEFAQEEFEVKDEMPDITNLLKIINAIPSISTATVDKDLDLASAANTSLEKYKAALHKLADDISDAKKLIIASDVPENKLEALEGNATAGYRKAVAEIKKLEGSSARFNSPNLEKDLSDLLAAAKPDIETAGANSETDDFFKEAYSLLNKQLVQAVNTIQKSIQQPDVIRLEIPVTDKNINVKLTIKKKSEYTALIRKELKDEVICVIRPEFERPALELVPVINLTYSSNVPKYSLVNDKINQGEDDGFKYRVGAMLLYNLPAFGKYKEGSLGFGLGYNIPKDNILNGFYVGTLLSYKKDFRVGIGIGFSEYPGGLKSNAVVGNPLPSDIKDLEDLIDYKRRVSGFITFSISGITILKK